jgi:hypothetical protein
MRVCLVLGAGASLANALHFRAEKMRQHRPPLDTTFFETVDARKIALSPALREYFTDVVGIDPTPATLRELRMEEVFKDVYYDFLESPTNPIALNAYIDLVQLYLRVLRETTNWLCEDKRSGGPIGQLLAAAAKAGDEVTVITFNHDLVIENEIYRRASLRKRWCLKRGYGSIGADLAPMTPVAARPMLGDHSLDCDHSRPITLLKLHGSLSWVVRIRSARPTANFLRGTGAPKQMALLGARFLQGTDTLNHSGRGRNAWATWPIVVPPVYAKQSLRGQLEPAWNDARDALARADRVVMFGYSLPAIDIEAEKLFERGLFRNASAQWVDVINPASATAARFAETSAGLPIRWYPKPKDFHEAGGF